MKNKKELKGILFLDEINTPYSKEFKKALQEITEAQIKNLLNVLGGSK